MSNSAPPPASGPTNATSTGTSPSPPPPTAATPPSPDSQSPPPIVPPPSPSGSASDATSEPPSSSTQNESPPPSLSPPAPPDDSSPPPPTPSSSVSPPPPPESNASPSLSAPPPTQALNQSASPLPVAPGQPASPSNNPPPTSQDSLPSSPPPVTSSPTPGNSLVTPPPPDTGTPPLTPPSQLNSPPVPEEPVNSPVSPTLQQTSPSTSIPSPTPNTPAQPTPSTIPDTKLPNNGSQLGPPSAHTSPSSSNHTSNTSSDGLGSGTFVGVTLAGVLLIVLAIFFVTSRKKRRRMGDLVNNYRPPATFSIHSDGYYGQVNQVEHSNHSDTYNAGNTTGSYRGYTSESAGIGGSKSSFTYEEIADMTHGFSRENLLGEGGFGCVYKGWLPDGRVVAVKQLKSGGGQGEREFRAEVEIISRVHHRHLVSLVGYCIADHQRSLVYEFVPNNTLEHHLHRKGLPVIDWAKRLKIAIGSSRGIAYLHEDCHPRIIHRDIKSANILLDNFFEAQVADFGLAKLSNDTYTHVSTRVMGTFGYMAPEYASSGKLTDRSDVFSFGVVLLELITGRKPVDPSQPLGDESLVEWARPRLVHSLETGDFEELADPRLENNYIKSEMFRMIEAAAACVRHSATKRPRMVQVLRALDNEGELADLSNGVKFGQSTVFESRQYSADIQQFRRMAFGSLDSSSECEPSGEYDRGSSRYSSEHSSREAPHRPLNS